MPASAKCSLLVYQFCNQPILFSIFVFFSSTGTGRYISFGIYSSMVTSYGHGYICFGIYSSMVTSYGFGLKTHTRKLLNAYLMPMFNTAHFLALIDLVSLDVTKYMDDAMC